MSESPVILTSTEFSRELSDVLNRVRYQGATFIIERGGEPVARVVPVTPSRFERSDLEAMFASLTRPDAAFLDELEAITRDQALATNSAWDT